MMQIKPRISFPGIPEPSGPVHLRLYGRHNGKLIYAVHKVSEAEVHALLKGVSVVKNGRHWWV